MSLADMFSKSSDVLSLLAAALSTVVIMPFVMRRLFPLLMDDDRRAAERKKRLRQNISEKLKAEIPLTVQDILDIGRGVGASRGTSVDVIYELLAESKDANEIRSIKQLITDLNKKAPFEDLPEEVKPSMLRILEMCEVAETESDKALLGPIHRALSNYKTMLIDHTRMRTQSRVSYVVAIVSFFIGVVGLIFAFRGPSKTFVQTCIEGSIKQHLERIQPNKALEATSEPARSAAPSAPQG